MMAQEDSAGRGGDDSSIDEGFGLTVGRFVFGLMPALLDFLRPGFHPDDQDNYSLAREYLAEVGRLDA